MPKLKIIHINDGVTLAHTLTKKFTENISCDIHVELLHLKPVSSPTQPASSGSAGKLVTISILLVTPAMMDYLKGLKEEERSSLAEIMKSEQDPVTLSLQVSVPQTTLQIIDTFHDADFQWRHLDVGESRKSCFQCVVELFSMLEETSGEMPIPTLKKFHFLPDKMVLAGDTIYILLEKHLNGGDPIQSLHIMFDDSSEVTANQIADCLYQFEVPESLESSRKVEVFTPERLSFGEDVIRYRDKLQVFVDILCQLLSPIETLCQSVETEELTQEKMDPVISDWFKFGKKMSSGDDTRTLLTQWVKSLQSDQISPEIVNQELPLFLYLCAKHNLHTFAQTLLENLRASDKGKGGPSQERATSESEKDVRAQSIVEKDVQAHSIVEKDVQALSSVEKDVQALSSVEKDVQALSSVEKDVQAHSIVEKKDDETSYEEVSELFTPGYCTPDDILIQPRSGKQTIYVDIAYENLRPRKISSAIIPGMVCHRVGKEKLCKSCPPVCCTHGHAREECSEPCYSNIVDCQQPTFDTLLGNSSDPQCTGESKFQAAGCSTSIHEVATECTPCKTSALPSQEEPSCRAGSSRILPRPPVEIPPSIKNDTPSRPPYPERPATPVMPKQNLKLSLVKNINIQDESDEDIKPRLPPRPNSDSSKSNGTPKKSRRLSLASPVSPSAPPLNHIHANSLSLPRPLKSKLSINGSFKTESYTPPVPPRPSEAVLSTFKNKTPPIPYSCRPSPPIPKIMAHKDEHSSSVKPTISSKRSGPALQLICDSGNRQLRSSLSESSQNSQNCQDDQDLGQASPDLPPDYSHPLNLYFQNVQSGFTKPNDQSELDEDIYDMVDEVSEFFQNSVMAEDCIYDVPRKFPLTNELEVQPTFPGNPQTPFPGNLQTPFPGNLQTPFPPPPVSPQSPIPPATSNSHGKKSSKTSPLWSSLSSKLSLKKQGKSKKHVTKL